MRFVDATDFEEILPALMRLFERSHGRRVSAEILRWRYLHAPSADLLMCVEESPDRSELIANYSASPCDLVWHSRKIRSALSNRTMTDPAYAGRGYFTRLATELYQEMRNRRYEMVWGFPNRNSHYAVVQKLCWRDIYQLPTLRLDLVGAAGSSCRFRFDDGFELRYPDIDSELLQVDRSADFLRWRYAANPVNRYRCLVLGNGAEVSAYGVVKPYGVVLDLVDFRATTREAGRELVESVVDFAITSGYHSVLCWAPRHHFMYPLCEKRGFIPVEPITYFCARAFHTGLEEIFDFSRWYLQMGDSDVY